MIGGVFRPYYTGTDWENSVEFYDTDTGQLMDLTGATFRLALEREPGCSIAIEASGTELMVMGENTLTWAIPPARLTQLAPGSYTVAATMVRDGRTKQLILGSLPVLDGVLG